MAAERQNKRVRVNLPLTPDPMRRVAVSAVLVLLGLWALWAALSGGPAPAGLRLVMAVLGAVAALGSATLWRATAVTLTLDDDGLSDSRGRVIARLGDVVAVERGALSLAPSGGFVLRLAAPGPAAWVPGVWWRVGTRVGVGGTTPRRMTREMATLIEAMLAVRDRG